MKQKNCLLLVIDSLNYSHVKESPINLMPYTKELAKKAIVCENMFSQGPFTEAATASLYCGQNTLDNGGYMFSFKNAPSTLFEEMQKYGYLTYYNSYSMHFHPSSLRRGVDALYYAGGYGPSSLWSYRFYHYSDLYKKGELNDEDYSALYTFFDDNFAVWIRFTDDIINHSESVSIIYDTAPNYDAESVKQQVLAEQSKYLKNPKQYVDEVLKTGNLHRFFKIPAYVMSKKISDRAAMIPIRKELKPLFDRIRSIQIRQNYKNALGKILVSPLKKCGDFIRHPTKSTFREFEDSGYLTIQYLFDPDLYQRINKNYDSFKSSLSGRTFIEHYINWAAEQSGDNPHFACIHIDDVHYNEEFFTWDSTDMNLIRKEIDMANEILDKIPKEYYGCVTHDLSLRYADSVIQYLFEQLEEKNLLDDTYVAVCADHGYSYSGNPIRGSIVRNLYLENYNIPFLLYGKDLPAKRITKLCASKDIPATLCNTMFGSVPESFTGHDVSEDFEYPCLMIEYCGGGCPDMKRRELKVAAFDKDYFVGTLGTIDNLDKSIITEIYDLKSDNRQLHNLVRKKYDPKKVDALFEHIVNRKIEMKKTMPRS
ncbi:MAG TPA: sulfatase-like hydrolase/transferase [Methanocorpusculum sp.]|nr:sulfatase-like hydrolase/transferase [Methanocorpusculum sp.]